MSDKEAVDASRELKRLRKNGTYIPPAKLKQLLSQIQVKEGTKEYQLLRWQSLSKKVTGIINKVSRENVKTTVLSLFRLNLIRGRGILVEDIISSSEGSDGYSKVYASVICVINSKIPMIGKLLGERIIKNFKLHMGRKDKLLAGRDLSLLSQLINFKVIHEIVVLQILYKLLENPDNTSIELACLLMNNCGKFLLISSEKATNAIFQRLRVVMSEGIVRGKAQQSISELLVLKQENFKNKPIIDEDLDIVEEEDKITHTLDFKDEPNVRPELNHFQYDSDYEENEKKYKTLKAEILGDSEDESASEFDDSEEEITSQEEEEFSESEEDESETKNKVKEDIKDFTEQELTHFQKTIYLTIMGSLNPEEAVHKLLQVDPIDKANNEFMITDMLVKCCAQERTYSKFYGLLGEGLIVVSNLWSQAFDKAFEENYENCHKYDTSLLRNIGSFWGHMFASDKMGWEVMKLIKLTADGTTSAQRILLKFVFMRIMNEIGENEFNLRISEEYIQPYIEGIFPHNNAENVKFSINYFTAIGLGKITEQMRTILKDLPVEENDDGSRSARSRSSSVSSVSSYSSSSGSSSSYSNEEDTAYVNHRIPNSREYSNNRTKRSHEDFDNYPGTKSNRVPLGKKRRF